ncbi:SAM-dependent methyltransferase [Streptomyces sp. NPDC057702]|uniref:SAM-dependent methyltransferase n=1 Tax=unclassified Streptomyces TaxID=2593676 RepID=UPI0036743106
MTRNHRTPLPLDTSTAHPARVYDYMLGGKTNYPADQDAGRAMRRVWPSLSVSMWQNRDFMSRAVAYLAREHGIRQFLDIGTGIPTHPNLHEVAQGIAPESRIVYVDNDPIVLAHAQALLDSTPRGRTSFLRADLRDPEAIMTSPEVRDTLDPSRPTVLSAIAVVHFLEDTDDPYGVVRRLLDPLPSGSFLALTTATADSAPRQMTGVAREYARRGMTMRLRSYARSRAFFAGLDLVDPGVVLVHHWRPGSAQANVPDRHVAMYGGVARKP